MINSFLFIVGDDARNAADSQLPRELKHFRVEWRALKGAYQQVHGDRVT